MKNKKRLVLSLIFVFFIFGVSLPLFMSNHKKIKADTLTNLTNTTWVFNNSISSAMGNTRYYINFYLESNTSVTYTGILCPNTGTILYYNGDNITNARQAGSWNSNSYKTIVITGGNDVTNSTLISWLQSNATQQQPSPSGTQITNQYWAPSGVFYLNNNVVYSDNSIEYFVLFNQYDYHLEDTEQIGLSFEGYNSVDEHCYIKSNTDYIYIGNSTSITNIMLLEFNVGDYMDTDLYNFMTLIGYWFDEYEPYNLGIYQGYIEGHRIGLAEGQADGVQYTNLVSGLFNGIGDLLNIQVFPNITIGLLIGLPLLLGVFVIIIKVLRG